MAISGRKLVLGSPDFNLLVLFGSPDKRTVHLSFIMILAEDNWSPKVLAPFIQRLFARRSRGKYRQCMYSIANRKRGSIDFCCLVQGHWFRHKTFDGLKWLSNEQDV